MKVYVYAQNCLFAGKRVDDSLVDASETPDDNADWIVYEGTEVQLLEIADSLERHASNDAGGMFSRRIARTIREAVS